MIRRTDLIARNIESGPSWRRATRQPRPAQGLSLPGPAVTTCAGPRLWLSLGLATVPVTGIKRERGAAARQGSAKPRLPPQLWAERTRRITPLGNREGRARGGPPRARRPAAANSQREPAGRGDPAKKEGFGGASAAREVPSVRGGMGIGILARRRTHVAQQVPDHIRIGIVFRRRGVGGRTAFRYLDPSSPLVPARDSGLVSVPRRFP